MGVEPYGFCRDCTAGDGQTPKKWLAKSDWLFAWGRMNANCPVWKGSFGRKQPIMRAISTFFSLFFARFSVATFSGVELAGILSVHSPRLWERQKSFLLRHLLRSSTPPGPRAPRDISGGTPVSNRAKPAIKKHSVIVRIDVRIVTWRSGRTLRRSRFSPMGRHRHRRPRAGLPRAGRFLGRMRVGPVSNAALSHVRCGRAGGISNKLRDHPFPRTGLQRRN